MNRTNSFSRGQRYAQKVKNLDDSTFKVQQNFELLATQTP